jgi:copper chaperone
LERNDMSTVRVTVTGMNCGHCATSVREEVGGIPGVKGVDVDLASGEVTVDSEGPVETAAIKSAVEEAATSSQAESHEGVAEVGGIPAWSRGGVRRRRRDR